VKHILIKLSHPGWEKKFDDRTEMQQQLYMHICEQCRAEEGITEISDTEQMLSTACGCEFMIETKT
jgi:hypothetical protein